MNLPVMGQFAVMGPIAKVLAMKIFIQYRGVIINRHDIIIDKGDSVGIIHVDVALDNGPLANIIMYIIYN